MTRGQKFVNPSFFTARSLISRFSFPDDSFNLFLSPDSLHDLRLLVLQVAVSEIQRPARKEYLMVGSYGINAEFFNPQCRARTAQRFLDSEERERL